MINRQTIRLALISLAFAAAPLITAVIGYPEALSYAPSFLVPALAAALITALALTFYSRLLRRFVTPLPHPARHKLRYAWIGYAVAAVLVASGQPLTVALAVGVVCNGVLILSLGWFLSLETLFAGIGIGALYVSAALVNQHVFPSYIDDVWFSANRSGITFLEIPLAHVFNLVQTALLAAPLFLAVKPYGRHEEAGLFGHAHIRLKVAAISLFLVAVLGSAGWFVSAYVLKPQGVVALGVEAEGISLDREVVLAFSRPVNREALQLAIVPPVAGRFEYRDPSFNGRLIGAVAFVPEQAFKAGTTYEIRATSAYTFMKQGETQYAYSFSTEVPPKLVSVSLQEDANVGICDGFTVAFDRELSGQWKPSFDLVPAAALEIRNGGAAYAVKPSACLDQGTEYTFSVSLSQTGSQEAAEQLSTVRFKTKSAPGLVSHSPKGVMVPLEVPYLELVFSQPMDSATKPEAYLSVSPAVAGSWGWSDQDRVLRYTPSAPLVSDTQYSVTVKKGFPEMNGGFFPADAVSTFTTITSPVVSTVSPQSGTSGQKIESTISITFDQPVDRASAESRFSIEPAVSGSFSWKGATMTFSPSERLGYSKTYAYRLQAGVVAATGLSSAKETKASFTTKAEPPAPPKLVTFGQSEQGRPITGSIFGSGSEVILFLGGIHGYKERSAGLLMQRFVQELTKNPGAVGAGKTVVIVPISNPDGYYGRTDKLNANEVNLNINFDTPDWKPRGGDNNDSAGSGPFSESESRVIRDIVARYKPSSMLSFHAKGALVNPESTEASRALARWYASRTGYSFFEDPSWNYPGTATYWFTLSTGRPSVTVELTSYATADWSVHQGALMELVK